MPHCNWHCNDSHTPSFLYPPALLKQKYAQKSTALKEAQARVAAKEAENAEVGLIVVFYVCLCVWGGPRFARMLRPLRAALRSCGWLVLSQAAAVFAAACWRAR